MSRIVTLQQKFIAQFLKAHNHADKSVCEVILTDEKFASIRDQVGHAQVFWSHAQWEDFYNPRSDALDSMDGTWREVNKYGCTSGGA